MTLRRKLTAATVAAVMATVSGSALADDDQPPVPDQPAPPVEPAEPAAPPEPPQVVRGRASVTVPSVVVGGEVIINNADGQAQAVRLIPAAVETAPQTFLGVSTGPLDEATAAQVDLPRGVGLIVAFVEEESPAAEAGIERLDVLHKLDDQLLVNTEQLTALVRMRDEGETASITLLRRGEERQVEVTFAQKELPVRRGGFGVGGGFGGGGGGVWAPRAEALTPEQLERIQEQQRRLVEQNRIWAERHRDQVQQAMERARQVQGLDAEHAKQIQEQVNRAVEEMRRAVGEEFEAGRFMRNMDELRRELDRARVEIDLLRPGAVLPQTVERSQTTIRDDNMVGRLVNEDGQTRLHIADREGNVLYEGPFPDDQTLAEMEPELRERVERFRRYARPAGAANDAPAGDDAAPSDAEPDDGAREQAPA